MYVVLFVHYFFILCVSCIFVHYVCLYKQDYEFKLRGWWGIIYEDMPPDRLPKYGTKMAASTTAYRHSVSSVTVWRTTMTSRT